jgi:hypothetical protein
MRRRKEIMSSRKEIMTWQKIWQQVNVRRMPGCLKENFYPSLSYLVSTNSSELLSIDQWLNLSKRDLPSNSMPLWLSVIAATTLLTV